jgi:hypothetical protein
MIRLARVGAAPVLPHEILRPTAMKKTKIQMLWHRNQLKTF